MGTECSKLGTCVTIPPTFIDAFAGCGGLSLGLLNSGWRSSFAIEQNASAFATYQSNLLSGRFKDEINWPDWLPQSNHSISELLDEHEKPLRALRGKIALVAGGPPCQGFSSAGRRKVNDPRNILMREYLKLVDLVRPKFVLMENVRGITQGFRDEGSTAVVNYSDELISALQARYDVAWTMVRASDYGVPQTRQRFILVGCEKDLGVRANDVIEAFDVERRRFLRAMHIVTPVDAKTAISDLEIERGGSEPSAESIGFNQIKYIKPLTHYQKLMHGDCIGEMTDLRLARHTEEVKHRFQKIIERCHRDGRLNVSLRTLLRDEFSMRKQALRVLDPHLPAPTITSMPDDLIHYSEPRTLTVRENARLQSFPDWFVFKGKYTSGGLRRRTEVPRFTQVANAVPPMMAQVLGMALLTAINAGKKASGSVEFGIDKHCDFREVAAMPDEFAA